MVSLTNDLRVALHEMTEAGEEYWTTSLESDGVGHVATVNLSEHRWYVRKLDVYRRKADGALAGIVWDCPASEMQEGQNRNALVVEVEEFTTTSWRVAKSRT